MFFVVPLFNRDHCAVLDGVNIFRLSEYAHHTTLYVESTIEENVAANYCSNTRALQHDPHDKFETIDGIG